MTVQLLPPERIEFPFTRQVVHIHPKSGDHLIYEGEAHMSQQQADAYKALIGDGKARVTVSKELSESDYGNGGKIMVSVSLTCDQSYNAVNGAISLANQVATYWADQHHGEMKQLITAKGIVT